MAKKPSAKKKAAAKKVTLAHDDDGRFVADDPATPENEHVVSVDVNQARREAQRAVGMRRLGGAPVVSSTAKAPDGLADDPSP